MNAIFKLLPEAVWTAAPADKSAVLEALAERFSSVYLLDRDDVLDGLQEREALGSTGFGRGVDRFCGRGSVAGRSGNRTALSDERRCNAPARTGGAVEDGAR
jgi:hypothetical protein